ncbi:MAG: hypothetical protein LBF04_01550 [Prevotellaceae bacterium]|jgi:hypothetical protein|nr:hypothetical protein [Prevotellaceae bacterium]
MTKLDIESILASGEHYKMEAKKAEKGIPNSLWETYSDSRIIEELTISDLSLTIEKNFVKLRARCGYKEIKKNTYNIILINK